MSAIPSWCRVGAKVVCIDDSAFPYGYAWEALPAVGEVYTIRSVDITDDVDLRFVELVNREALYEGLFGGIGVEEVRFYWKFFRPLVTIEDDLEAHFSQLLIVSTPQRVDA